MEDSALNPIDAFDALKFNLRLELRERNLAPGELILREAPVAEPDGRRMYFPADSTDAALLAAWNELEQLEILAEGSGNRQLYRDAAAKGFGLCSLVMQGGGNGVLGEATVSGLKAQRGGYKRAWRMHGVVTSDLIAEWQSEMDRVCSNTHGIGRSAAWDKVEELTGSKRETLERHGVTCPIPGSRGPAKKTPP